MEVDDILYEKIALFPLLERIFDVHSNPTHIDFENFSSSNNEDIPLTSYSVFLNNIHIDLKMRRNFHTVTLKIRQQQSYCKHETQPLFLGVRNNS